MARYNRYNRYYKKNKKNKGQNMENVKNTIGFDINATKSTTNVNSYNSYNSYNRYGRYGYYGYVEAFKKPSQIRDYTKTNYVLMNQEILNEIMKKCLPHAGGSEFQFHYWALQIKLSAEDKRVFNYTIPLAFFNFSQEVSSGSVDFNLIEVDAEAQKVKEQAKELAKKIIKAFPKSFFESLGLKVKFEFGDVGSIHRHPGRFGFSSIDLRYDPKKPGVIFRNKEGRDLWQTDSVLYCDQDAELVTTETRVFNTQQVDPNDEDKGSTGTVSEIPTLMIMIGGKDKEVERTINFNDFFGAKNAQKEIKNYFIKKTMQAQTIEDAIKIAEAICLVFKPLDFVIESRIKQRSFGFNYTYLKNNKTDKLNSKKAVQESLQELQDLHDLYDSYSEGEWETLLNKDNFDLTDLDEDDKFYKKIKSNIDLKSKKDLVTDLMEIIQIPDIERFDENALWKIAEDKTLRTDLLDIYIYYRDYKTELLTITIDSGKLTLDDEDIIMQIGTKVVYQSKWFI